MRTLIDEHRNGAKNAMINRGMEGAFKFFSD